MRYEKVTLTPAAVELIVVYLSGQHTLNVFVTIALLEFLILRA